MMRCDPRARKCSGEEAVREWIDVDVLDGSLVVVAETQKPLECVDVRLLLCGGNREVHRRAEDPCAQIP